MLARKRKSMPKIYRAMKKDDDDKPYIEQSANGLGVRPNHDIDVDVNGNAIANKKGMSVAQIGVTYPRGGFRRDSARLCRLRKGRILLSVSHTATDAFKMGQ